MTWAEISPWLGLAGAVMAVLAGARWAFQADRVVANPNSGVRDPASVRAFGYVVLALGAAMLLLKLFEFFSE